MEAATHSKNGLPTPYSVSNSASQNQQETENIKINTTGKLKAKPPLSSLIRLTVPASVAQLVKYFNCTQTKGELQELEEAVRDVLCRLEMLVLASYIPDSSQIRFRIRTTTKHAEKSVPTETTIKSSSEGRISALMMTRCRSKILRDKSLALLVDALDTNYLATSPHETMHLQMLWVEMIQLFRHVLDNLRTRSFQMFDNGRAHSAATNRTDLNLPRTDINIHLESLLTCISLTLQRLDHIQDITGVPLPQSNLMSQSYTCLLEDLDLCSTKDPFTYSLVSSIRNQLSDWISQSTDSSFAAPSRKQISLDLGVHVLSQVIRMTLDPSTLSSLSTQFINVFHDLQHDQNWNSGKKLLTLLGTAASLNTHIISLFIELLNNLEGLYWQWRFLGVGILGSIVLSAPSPVIRKVAMEQGLIPSLYFTNDKDATQKEGGAQDSNELKSEDFQDDDSWLVRASAVVALTEIYQQIKSNVHGLLAREVMQDRRQREKHPRVLKLLDLPKAKTPQIVYVPRLSTLFKHTSIAFAEVYVTLESEYKYMRGFLEKAEKTDRALQQKLQQKVSNAATRIKLKTKNTVPKLNHLISVDSSKVAAPPQFLNIQQLHLSDFASSEYHTNYKRPPFNHDSYESLLPHIASSSPLKIPAITGEQNVTLTSPSYLSTTPGIQVPPHSSLTVGTANRRKLFNPQKKDDELDSRQMKMKKKYYDDEMPDKGRFLVKIPNISVVVTST